MTVADPTTVEWIAAGVAAGLVVLVGAVLVLRPVLRRSAATPWGLTGGVLLAALAVGLVLVVAVVAVAGWRADVEHPPAGPFAGVLVATDPATATRVSGYAAALLLPLAAVLLVLAVAVVDLGRSSGLRIAAGVAVGVVLSVGVLLAVGDAGSAPRVAGWAAAALAGAAGLALALDELVGGRQPGSGPSGPSKSDSSTTSSQRSLQSRHR